MIADPHEAEDDTPLSPVEVRLLFYGGALGIVFVLFLVTLFTG